VRMRNVFHMNSGLFGLTGQRQNETRTTQPDTARKCFSNNAPDETASSWLPHHNLNSLAGDIIHGPRAHSTDFSTGQNGGELEKVLAQNDKQSYW